MSVRENLLIFDFDGTIADSMPLAESSFNQIATEFRFPTLDAEQFNTLKSQSTLAIIKTLGIPWWKLPAIVRRGRQMLGEQLNTIQPYQGMPEVLSQLLESHHHFGILTSNSRENVERFFVNHHLPQPIFIDSVSRLKNKAVWLKKRRRQYRDAALMYVGDEVRDVEAAHRAGVTSIAVDWGFNTRRSLETARAQRVISSPDEILEVVYAQSSKL